MVTNQDMHNNAEGGLIHRFNKRTRWVFHTVHRFDRSLPPVIRQAVKAKTPKWNRLTRGVVDTASERRI